MTVVKNLKKSREDMELSQKYIASDLEVHYTTFNGWEKEQDLIPLKRLIQYANKYNYSLDYLFGLTLTNQKYLPLEIDLKVIATNLKNVRKKYKFTQKELADKLNTSQSTYSAYESGKVLISTIFLYGLINIYEYLSIDELLGRKKDK